MEPNENESFGAYLNRAIAERDAFEAALRDLVNAPMCNHDDKEAADVLALVAALNVLGADSASVSSKSASKGKPMFNYNGDLVGYETETSFVACGICDRIVPPGCEGKFKASDPHCLLNTVETPERSFATEQDIPLSDEARKALGFPAETEGKS